MKYLIKLITLTTGISALTLATDLSAGLQVEASSWESKAHGGFADFPPQNVIDGILSANSSWRGEGDGVWIQFDLETPTQIRGIALGFFKGATRKYTFDILISESGEADSWTEVSSRLTSSGTTENLEAFEFDSVSTRFIRLVGHGNTTENFPDWFNLTEAVILAK